MNALSQTAFEDALILDDLAERIRCEGPRSVLGCNLSAREDLEWSRAAQRYIDWQGDDDGDFASMVDEHFNPASDQGWALDLDFLRDERAEQSVWGMA